MDWVLLLLLGIVILLLIMLLVTMREISRTCGSINYYIDNRLLDSRREQEETNRLLGILYDAIDTRRFRKLPWNDPLNRNS